MDKRKTLWALLAVLVVVNMVLAVLVFAKSGAELKVAFLDVGQGDAILITGPTGHQVLIDGGRDRSVLRELGRQMSPFDRSIDVVIATHPDADHIAGLSGVFERYKVGGYVSSGVENDTSQTQALVDAVEKEKGIQEVEARRGMRLDIGGGAYIDILFPDRDVSKVETNTGSVVARLVYGQTSFLLTGDSPLSVEDYLVSLGENALESTVLKAGHHGSRTSTGETCLEAVDPEYVVVSAGKDNGYGHPHTEVIERIKESGATMLSTAEEGTIMFMSNGTEVVVR